MNLSPQQFNYSTRMIGMLPKPSSSLPVSLGSGIMAFAGTFTIDDELNASILAVG
jgi:hypothetical protein